MHGCSHYEDTPLRWKVLTARDDGSDVSMPLVLVYDEVFGTDEDTTWPVRTPWDLDEHVAARIDRFRPFPYDVVEPEVQLIEGELLLCLSCRLSGWILICITVVELNRSKDGVIEIDTQRYRFACR